MADDRLGERAGRVVRAGAAALLGRLQDRRAGAERRLLGRAADVDDGLERGGDVVGGRGLAEGVGDALAEIALALGFVLQVLGALRPGLQRRQRLEVGVDGRAVVLAGADGEDAAGGGLDGEAHHRLVDRADLLDVEGAVGEPLADLGRRVLDGHQVLQDPQEAAVGDGQHARGVVGGAAAFEEGERVGVEELAAPRADEARGVAGVDQVEERQEPAPAALALLHRVGVEGGVLGELGVEAARANSCCW